MPEASCTLCLADSCPASDLGTTAANSIGQCGMHAEVIDTYCSCHFDLRIKAHALVSHVHDDVVQEANAINKSLTFLEQTVNALSKREAHVPFRQSKLTSLLRDALGGNCKTV